MEGLIRDARFAIRLLVKNPGFTLTVILLLALGIGINATIFSLVNALLLRPLPVAAPEGLVRLYATAEGETTAQRFPYPDYEAFRDNDAVFSDLTATGLATVLLGTQGESEQLLGEVVTGNYFTTFGLTASLGRLFTAADDQPGAPPVAVISHALWQQRFGADVAVVGTTVMLNGSPYTLLGVVPAHFLGTFAGAPVDTWTPIAHSGRWLGAEWRTAQDRPTVHPIGRLQPGVSQAQARAALDTQARQLAAAFPDSHAERGVEVAAATLVHGGFRRAAATFLSIMTIMVALVLFVACANIANLLLARVRGRQREMALRLALGARRVQLLRQLMVESLLLSAAGGAAGVAMAWWAADLLAALRPLPFLSVRLDLGIDPRVLGYTFLLALASGFLLGLVPALTILRRERMPSLRTAGATAGRRGSRMRSAFLVAQVAFSSVLLVTGGLFLRSLTNAHTLDPGFETTDALAMDIDLEPRGVTKEEGLLFYRTLLQRVTTLPGVRAASLADLAPLDVATPRRQVAIPGHEPQAEGPPLRISFNPVDHDYFRTLDIPLRTGRFFNARDNAVGPPVAIINETMAQRFWPQSNPIGARFRHGEDALEVEVIGVVGDVKYRSLGEAPTPHMYLPFAQHYQAGMTLIVRTEQAPGPLVATVQQTVRAVDADVQGFFARTFAEHLSVSLLPSRLAVFFLGAFAALALALAVVGIYGATAYAVAQRRREIGIRMALGALRRDVLRLALRDNVLLLGIGLGLGLLLALAAGRLVSSLLLAVNVADPLTLLVVSALLAAAVLAASYLPARRATRVDPLIALRHD